MPPKKSTLSESMPLSDFDQSLTFSMYSDDEEEELTAEQPKQEINFSNYDFETKEKNTLAPIFSNLKRERESDKEQPSKKGKKSTTKKCTSKKATTKKSTAKKTVSGKTTKKELKNQSSLLDLLGSDTILPDNPPPTHKKVVNEYFETKSILSEFTDIIQSQNEQTEKLIDRDSWSEKYKPKTIEEFVGNKQIALNFVRWLRNFHTKSTFSDKNAAVITGPIGCGKSSLIEMTIDQYDIVHIDASNKTEQNNKNIVDEIFTKIRVNSVGEKGFVIVIENPQAFLKTKQITEIKNFLSRNKRGSYSNVVNQVIKEENGVTFRHSGPSANRHVYNPVVFVLDDLDDRKIRGLLDGSVCDRFDLKEISHIELVKFYSEICKKENFYPPEGFINRLCSCTGSDIRTGITILEMIVKSKLPNGYNDMVVLEEQLQLFKSDKFLFGKTEDKVKTILNSQIISSDYQAKELYGKKLHVDDLLRHLSDCGYLVEQNLHKNYREQLINHMFVNKKTNVFGQDALDTHLEYSELLSISDSLNNLNDCSDMRLYHTKNYFANVLPAMVVKTNPPLEVQKPMFGLDSKEPTKSIKQLKKFASIFGHSSFDAAYFPVLFRNIFYIIETNKDPDRILRLVYKPPFPMAFEINRIDFLIGTIQSYLEHCEERSKIHKPFPKTHKILNYTINYASTEAALKWLQSRKNHLLKRLESYGLYYEHSSLKCFHDFFQTRIEQPESEATNIRFNELQANYFIPVMTGVLLQLAIKNNENKQNELDIKLFSYWVCLFFASRGLTDDDLDDILRKYSGNFRLIPNPAYSNDFKTTKSIFSEISSIASKTKSSFMETRVIILKDTTKKKKVTVSKTATIENKDEQEETKNEEEDTEENNTTKEEEEDSDKENEQEKMESLYDF